MTYEAVPVGPTDAEKGNSPLLHGTVAVAKRSRFRLACRGLLASVAFILLGLVALVAYTASLDPATLHANLFDAVASDPELMELNSLQASGGDVPLITSRHIAAMEKVVDKSWVFNHWKMLFSVLPAHLNDWRGMEPLWADLMRKGHVTTMLTSAYLSNKFVGSLMFRYTNFVQGFPIPGFWGWWSTFCETKEKFKPPVVNETLGVVSFNSFAKQNFGKVFPYAFFDNYYTGNRIPSWEDDVRHAKGMSLINAGVKAGRAILHTEPMSRIRAMEPRIAFDNEALKKVGWDGFSWMTPDEIKYASNGVFGVSVVDKLLEKYKTTDTLGILMTNSVFSAHLKNNNNVFELDLSSLAQYTPLPGYAPLGGKATFAQVGNRLKTVGLEYNNTKYTNFDDIGVDADFAKSKLTGWRFAEKSIIASLLAMTNLVTHVQNLHLEIAAAFQAVTIDAFAPNPEHPVRRLLDPFIHRSVQATNDNFRLLFDYKAAEFSLAPLPYDEQLRLIDDSITNNPLNMAELDMENFGKARGMPEVLSEGGAQTDPNTWGWRWHYRALTVQRLYDKMIQCWLEAHYGGSTPAELDANLAKDILLQKWWTSMIKHLPSMVRATQLNPEWASTIATSTSIKNVLRTLMVWLSWIHEDVGHSAAAFVYNPVHTPMAVPMDGVGVPLASWAFNVLAYRGFVFLERAVLLGQPPDFWFDKPKCTGSSWFTKKCSTPIDDRKCFIDLQATLIGLGANDPAFSECDTDGFYSCVERVETAVSS